MTSVDVVVPVFNDQIRLNRLLASLARQTLSPLSFGVIVVDNGSEVPVTLPDGLPFDCRLIFCAAPGSYAARNLAWPLSNAPWIAFTDSDCLPDDTWLEAGLKAAHGQADGVLPRLLAGRIQMIPSSDQALTSADLLELSFGMNQERYVRSGGYGITANLWVERSLLELLDGFNALRKSGSDRDFCLRASQYGVKVFYVEGCSLRHPARSQQELELKARRLIGGRVDAAGPKFVSRLLALVMHTRPLLREGWVCLWLPLPWMDRCRMLRLMLHLRLIAMSEWFSLVFLSSLSQR